MKVNQNFSFIGVKFAEFVVHQCSMKIDDGSGLKNDSNFLDSIG